ncbi:MAG: hypothetical protein RJB13_1648 [Pseudomonadota bacterium]
MFKPLQLVDFAKKAMDKALALTEEEGKALLGKLPLEQLGQKTTTEIEKIVSGLVEKLFSGLTDPVEDTVKNEVVKMVVEMNTMPKNVVSHLRYVNELFQATAPKNLGDLKTLRTTIAMKLIEDAQVRLANTTEVAAEGDQDSVAPVVSKRKSSKQTQEKSAE